LQDFQNVISSFLPAPQRDSGANSGYNGGVEFALRDFRPEDFEILWNIDQKCFAPGIAYSRRELLIYIRRRGSFTVVAEDHSPETGTRQAANQDSKVVGFIVAEANRRGVGHIISIDVLPGARRSGVGSKLLAVAEDRFRADGCHAVELETAVDNISALSFYKRHLYHVVKALPRYYSNGTDALVLEKELAQTKDGTAG
jgi:[ribosomal protein S18]-alanine N-acetyltransferase